MVAAPFFGAPKQQVIVSRGLLLHESFQGGPQMDGKRPWLPRSWPLTPLELGNHPHFLQSFLRVFGILNVRHVFQKKTDSSLQIGRKETIKPEHEVWKKTNHKTNQFKVDLLIPNRPEGSGHVFTVAQGRQVQQFEGRAKNRKHSEGIKSSLQIASTYAVYLLFISKWLPF